jgi:hypothetical protein
VVSSITPQPLYPWGSSSGYTLCRRLGGLKRRPGFPSRESNPHFSASQPILFAVPTELFWEKSLEALLIVVTVLN